MVDERNYSFKKYGYQSIGLVLIGIQSILPIHVFFDMDIFEKDNWILFVFILLFYICFSIAIAHHSLYYLEINKKEIVVRNILFFWFRRIYSIKDVNAIYKVRKSGGRGGWYGIVIVEKHLGYKNSSRFLMDSINTGFWKDLERQLNKVGIKYYE